MIWEIIKIGLPRPGCHHGPQNSVPSSIHIAQHSFTTTIQLLIRTEEKTSELSLACKLVALATWAAIQPDRQEKGPKFMKSCQV